MKNKLLFILFSALLIFYFTGCEKKDSKYGSIIKVNIEVQDYGTISLDLYPDVAPITVDNFVSLVKNGFYDGSSFHRIISGFMIQGGSFKGDGVTGSSKKIKGEFKENNFENSLKHERGTISMARANDYNSASSQFFIMHKDTPSIDGKYAAFGRVTKGIEIVDEICSNTQVEDSNGTTLKENRPIITRIYVVE